MSLENRLAMAKKMIGEGKKDHMRVNELLDHPEIIPLLAEPKKEKPLKQKVKEGK